MKNNQETSKINPNAKYIPSLDDYELPAEFPFDRHKMKRNPYAKGARLPENIKRAGNGRKPSSLGRERHTITLTTQHAKYLRSLDPNLSRAISKLVEQARR